MRKITYLLSFLIIASFSNLTAQYRLMSKERARALYQTVKPVEHHYDQLRNVNGQTFLFEDFNAGAVPSGWSVTNNTGDGQWNVVADYNGNTLDGSPFAFADSDAAGNGTSLDTELISPTFDTSAAGSLFISFDQFFATYTGGDKADVDVYDGTQWVNVYTNSSNIGAWGNPDHQLIDVTAYKNANFRIRFHYYDAAWEYYWAVDNVKIFEPYDHDLAAVNALPETFLPNLPFDLKGFIYNNGVNSEDTFDVTFDIKDASNTSVFNETVNVTGANLASGGTYMVSSTTQPSLAEGTYTLEVSVNLSGDGDTSNDMYSTSIYIIDYPSTYSMDVVYSYVTFDGDTSGDDNNLVTFDINNGNKTAIAPLVTGDFLIAGTFINNVMVGVEFGTNNIYLISGAGEAHKLGALSGDIGNEIVTGIAYDAALGQAFVCTGAVLLSVDINTLNTTVIGAMNNAGGVMIGIDVDNNGNMYGIDLGDDQLYSIDPTTGAATAIGALGVDIRFAQDMGADPTTGNLYGTLYEVGGGTGGLYSIDKVTGAATAIGTPGDDEYTVCAILGTTVSISENTIEGLNVYPNPTNGMILINAKENIENISVINITGQEVMKIDNNGLNAQLDLSNLTAGSYILKITTDKTVATYQVIKK